VGLGSELSIVRSVPHMAGSDDWALIGLIFFFGLLMQWRKNLYPLIAFHFLVNIVWGAIIGALLK
jgi:membrane protease YdiL (CAAX protease family)